jgi:hypothetical protein
MNHSAALFRLILIALAVFAALPARAGTKVLYLGDSLSFGAFGATLDKQLRQSGCEVYTMVTGGATPYYWLSDFAAVSGDAGHWVKQEGYERRLRKTHTVPKIEPLLKKFHPDAAVIQTGTNLYAALRDKKKTPAERVKTVEYLVDRMCRVLGDAKCRIYWITPPDSHIQKYPRELQEQMREIMKRVAGRYGRVFDSYAVTRYTDPYPQEDGIHYGPEQATEWARRVARDAIPWISQKQTADASLGSAPLAPAPSDPLPEETVRKAQPVLNRANTLRVEAVLKEKTPFLNPRSAPYRNAVAFYEYQVVKVIEGENPGQLIRVAHVVMRNNQLLPELNWEPGRHEVLTLVPLASYPDTEKLETLDELPEANLPILTPRQDS